MERLSPLVICFLMAMSAIACRQKSIWLDEGISFHRSIAWYRDLTVAEGKVVVSRHLVGIGLACRVLVADFLVGLVLIRVRLDRRKKNKHAS